MSGPLLTQVPILASKHVVQSAVLCRRTSPPRIRQGLRHSLHTGLAYKAYWFAPADSLVVIKNGLLLEFRVSDNPGSPGAQINQDRKAEDIKLADEIVPRVG